MPLPESGQRPERLSTAELRDVWRILDSAERVDGFRLVGPDEAEEFFLALPTHDQLDLLQAMVPAERRLWSRLLPPDDAVDLIQEAPEELRPELMAAFDEPTRREVRTLLAYAEEHAGGLMSPRYARVRPDMTVDEAILYMRRQASQNLETIYYGYVLDKDVLLGVVSFRDLFQARGNALVRDVMHTDLVTVAEDMDQEAVGLVMDQHNLLALPVVDAQGRMKGIVTLDDIVDVVRDEATEDIQKIGGTEALDAPYLEVGFLPMLQKRAGWLTILFLAQFFTISVMEVFEGRIRELTALTLFVPLIISSGGNSGSQAATLVTRAMALREVRMRDWLRVLSREAVMGLTLGGVLGSLGLVRILLGHVGPDDLGPQYLRLGATVATSVLGVVLWGTLSGSMLPFALRRLGADPASASAPMIATLTDVVGLLIYFGTARLWLG
jgi:magnesium transporter